jgi:hypothetical protein
MTAWDARLITNGNPILMEINDNYSHELRGWEQNVVAARWTPATGWIPST